MASNEESLVTVGKLMYEAKIRAVVPVVPVVTLVPGNRCSEGCHHCLTLERTVGPGLSSVII